MTISITPPQPGDLITANLMKQLIDALLKLDVRITALEVALPGAGGALRISTIESDATVGVDTLHIHGVNFGLPSENVVTFDSGNGVIPSAADGSDDQLLLIKVPSLSLLADSQVVTVTVSNSRTGQDSRQVNMHRQAATKPAGSLSVGRAPANDSPGSPTAGGSFVFGFAMTVITTLDETFTLQPSVPPPPAGEAAWQASMVTGTDGNTALPLLIGSSPPKWLIQIPRTGGTPTIVQAFFKLTIPATTSITNGSIGLTVASLSNPTGFTGGGSPLITVTPGVTLPANQTVQFGSVIGTGGGTIVGNTGTFAVPTTAAAGLSFSLPSLNAGTYQMGLSFPAAVNGWGAKFDAGAAQIRQFVLGSNGSHMNELVDIAATAVTGDGVLNITVMTPPPTTTPPFRVPTQAELNACAAFGIFALTLTKKTP